MYNSCDAQNDGINSQRRTLLYQSRPECDYVLQCKQKNQSRISARLLHAHILAAIAYDTQGIVGYDTGSLPGITLATGTEWETDCQSNRIYIKIFCSFTKVKRSNTFINTPLLTFPHITRVSLEIRMEHIRYLCHKICSHTSQDTSVQYTWYNDSEKNVIEERFRRVTFRHGLARPLEC